MRSRAWQPLEVALDGRTPHQYAYLRFIEPAAQPVLVVLNFSGARRVAQITIPGRFAALARAGVLNDELGGEMVEVGRDGTLRIPMTAWGARVLTPAPPEP